METLWQDSEWEEAEAGDAEDHDLLYSVDATSYSRPSYEHLDAMAKVLNEVNIFIYIKMDIILWLLHA